MGSVQETKRCVWGDTAGFPSDRHLKKRPGRPAGVRLQHTAVSMRLDAIVDHVGLGWDRLWGMEGILVNRRCTAIACEPQVSASGVCGGL